jgi:hypothetical protein
VYLSAGAATLRGAVHGGAVYGPTVRKLVLLPIRGVQLLLLIDGRCRDDGS